ncbi:MAG: phosphoglucomutase (alpha-D-glucose-1,6-bisphosphate-dependent) [Polyangiales bacterium]
MNRHPRAGTTATTDDLVDVGALVAAYHNQTPDPDNGDERVSFGTSGHRGSSLRNSFNDAHIACISQAICDYRQANAITGPLYVGIDTHALSENAQQTALEVFVANGVHVRWAGRNAYTPTPVISRAIIVHNRANDRVADGVVITPSHNPPEDGGFKYNPPHGGPADGSITDWIESRANALLRSLDSQVKRVRVDATHSDLVHDFDFVSMYVADLQRAIDLRAIEEARISMGADPMGGAGVHYWSRIAEQYSLNIDVVRDTVDPTFRFMTLDRDGKIRMDCSSPDAMAGLLALKDRYDIAFGNDTDFDRHGVVTPDHGLLNPNHYLSVCVDYLFQNRKNWPEKAAIGKTLVSSSMIDRVAARAKRDVIEVPVGFKWFVYGLNDGRIAFAGEESAGATLVEHDGNTWTTDKDGFVMALLAAEILATTEKNPAQHYNTLTQNFGTPVYTRIDAPATREQKAALRNLTAADIITSELGGDSITSVHTEASGNGAKIGGVKINTSNGWIALRPSGTEDVYKIYAESFVDDVHLQQLVDEAQDIVATIL